MEKQYLSTPQGQVHVRLAGRPFLPPLVLLHQTPSSGVMFERMIPLLAEQFWVLAPDLPGFGNSFAPERPFTVPLWAEAITHMLQSLQIGRCALFGHHTGAAVAVQIAYSCPNLVNHLVLSGPPLLDEPTKQRLRAGLPTYALHESGDFLLNTWQRIRQKNSTADLSLSLRETLLSLQLNGRYAEAYEAVFAHDFATQLAALTCPLLLLAGERDSLRASLEPAHALAPHSQVKLLPNTGTYLCDEEPELITAVLHDFIL